MSKLRVERPNRRNALGAEGERRAADHLKGRGYRIVARNVRAGGVEMDVIARRGPLLVFVEVKTRRSRNQGLPEDAVDARKRARLIRGAAAWLHEHGQGVRRTRFDVIVCECDAHEQSWQLRHLEAAFDASG
jgi:putative endonuclease